MKRVGGSAAHCSVGLHTVVLSQGMMGNVYIYTVWLSEEMRIVGLFGGSRCNAQCMPLLICYYVVESIDACDAIYSY